MIRTIVILACVLIYASAGLTQPDLRFMVTGDSRGDYNGVNTPILTEIAQAIVDEDVEFVMFVGDLVNGSLNPATLESQLMNWRTIMQPVYDAGIGVYPCRGNHDTGSKSVWDDVFTGPYALPPNGPPGEINITFSFAHGNAFVVGLDQYVSYHRVNQTWLHNQLATNTQPHIFVFGHVPAFSVDHSDCLDDYASDRDVFWNSIGASGGRYYFTGHDHFYNHARIDDDDDNITNDIHQYLVGSAGAPLRDWDGLYNGANGAWTPVLSYHEKEYGYLMVEIDGADVSLTWKHRVTPGLYEPVPYGCGNPDTTGRVDIDDVVYLVDYLFTGGPVPVPYYSGNVNCLEPTDLDDIIYLIDYIFTGGSAPCDTDGDGIPDC